MLFRILTKREILNDEDNSHYAIAPDDKGMGCVEIRDVDKFGKMVALMRFPPDEARQVAKALIACADELEGLKDNA